jgi:hypothetical protein
MYYSEFTLKLIDEVKKREILYNTKYEKRPKSEKESSWKQIEKELDSKQNFAAECQENKQTFYFAADSEKCKKHWKNIRDRYVKVMHQRDKHFANGGTELNAPQYIYFDKLNFMREFSIQKDPLVEATSAVSVSTTLSPDHLLFEEFKDSTGETVFFDYTEQFLLNIKRFPVLFDQHAEMRKYRAKEAWKQVADSLGSKFTVGRLRHYWMTLVKKYKMYLDNAHGSCEPITNEALFESLSFANVGLKVKQEEIQYIVQADEMDSSQEFYDDLNDEEHLLCEEVEPEAAADTRETAQAVESIEEISEPEPKKPKIDPEPFKLPDFRVQPQEVHVSPAPSIVSQPQLPAVPADDEFDYFGKKVALQLRDLAHKNRSLARKGEIKVLQLLMELEESLES